MRKAKYSLHSNTLCNNIVVERYMTILFSLDRAKESGDAGLFCCVCFYIIMCVCVCVCIVTYNR